MLAHQREVTRSVRGINKLNEFIDWEVFRKDLEALLGYDRRDGSKGGRPPFDPVLMLKILLLQKYYGLSDDQDEAVFADSAYFSESNRNHLLKKAWQDGCCVKVISAAAWESLPPHRLDPAYV